MNETTIATSLLQRDSAGAVFAFEGEPFDPQEYSRMKYGSIRATQQLGWRLGGAIVRQDPAVTIVPRVTALSIYKTVPSAAAGLTAAAMCHVNQARTARGLEPVEPVHVKMGRVLGVDYSTLDEAGRRKYIEDTGYTLRASDVRGTYVVLIDDIRVTGSAERLGRDLLRDMGHNGLLLAYLAIMDEASAQADAAVEKRINVSAVTTLQDILDIVHTDGLVVTLRTTKRVLEEENDDLLREFLFALPETTLFELYAGVLSSGLDYIQEYQRGFNTLKEVTTLRRRQPVTSLV